MTSLEIHVDDREHALLEEIQKIAPSEGISVGFVRRTMPLGDAAIVDRATQKILLLYERKSLQDLLASITDGRYKEQSFRLLNTPDLPAPHNIVYIIEGILSSVRQPAQRQRVFSAIASLQYFKQMSVMRTATVQETAELLLRTAEKIAREVAKPAPSEAQAHVLQEYVGGSAVAAATKVKRENITAENIGEILLCQIPGISAITAKVVLDNYGGSFARMLRAMEDDPVKARAEFAEMCFPNGRRLPRNCFDGIARFLVPSMASAP